MTQLLDGIAWLIELVLRVRDILLYALEHYIEWEYER